MKPLKFTASILAILAIGIFMKKQYPRGVRNNNPGNIEANGIKWRGMVGDDGRFIKFDKMTNGVRALSIILINYYYKHGLTSVEGIINRYAPPVENDSGAYVKAVANAVGVGASEKMSSLKPYLSEMVNAIIKHENGRTIADYDIQRGISLALEYKGLA